MTPIIAGDIFFFLIEQHKIARLDEIVEHTIIVTNRTLLAREKKLFWLLRLHQTGD